MGRDQAITVCHIVSGDLWAGAEVQAFTLLKGLTRIESLKLSVIIMNDGELAHRLKEIGIKTTICDETRNSFGELNRMVSRTLRETKPDILHSHRIKENVLAGLAVKRGDAGHAVATVHGLPETKQLTKRIKQFPQRKLEEWLLKNQFDKLLPVSNDIANQLVPKFGVLKVQTVHNAFDMNSARVTKQASEVRAELGINPDQPVIGTAGRMVPVKRYDRFLDAARLIVNEKPEALFVLAGDGPLLNDLRTHAKDIGIADRVIFTGFRKDIIDLINCFDLFMISSEHEGIPMVILEAMTLKKVVVGFHVGGLPEIINSDQCGALVEPYNCRTLANRSLEFINDSEKRIKTGENAYTRIASSFSLDRLTREINTIYESLMN